MTPEQRTYTRAQIAALKPCSLGKLGVFKGRDALTVAEALEAGASIDDLLWVAGRLGLKTECVRFAIACARRVAHLNPDPRVQAAIDAAQAWMDNPTDDNRAAWAAAWNAAWEAECAARAARAAGDAARAAWDAAGAARAAGDAERMAQRALFIEIFGGSHDA